jgi:diguanylate cyclase (GGDEF)-like protein/putative nucleotidyltransferase with HDIG domain
MNRRRSAARIYAGGAIAAACAAAAASTFPVPAVWLALPAVTAIYFGVRAIRSWIDAERGNAKQLSELHLASLEALALAIDAKEQITPNHVRRVQAYATALARALRMPESEVQAVRTAALLHDIGKLAVPDHILAKPGPLTPEELQKVRLHPQMGAAILKSVPFPYPVTPFILSHHERWDGRGYPAGLKGEEIPLGARVVCVVDYFDALTSERPYHKALSEAEAVALLKDEAGNIFDPRVVDAFVRILPALSPSFNNGEASSTKTASQADSGERLPSRLAAGQERQSSVFDDIALANREIYALYQIAQTMGTTLAIGETMALVSSKLSSAVPFAACGLFLYSEATEQLVCRFAIGTDSEEIQQLTMRIGNGLSGWVARHRRPLLNARPSVDFETIDAPTVLQSALVCPLLLHSRLIGTLALYHTEPGFYREDHGRLLERVCEQAAAVIHNAIVFEQTQQQSLTDPLTGLPNSRSLVQHLQHELARAGRQNTEIALIILDLDGFKAINDTHGHRVGDCALQEVARALSATIRTYDICVRYAGDEFIAVLSGCGREEAAIRCRELQDAVGRIVLEVEGTGTLHLSISAGLAIYPEDGDGYEALLAAADRGMYRDKNRRKNESVA